MVHKQVRQVHIYVLAIVPAKQPHIFKSTVQTQTRNVIMRIPICCSHYVPLLCSQHPVLSIADLPVTIQCPSLLILPFPTNCSEDRCRSGGTATGNPHRQVAYTTTLLQEVANGLHS